VARIREICGREAEFIPQWEPDLPSGKDREPAGRPAGSDRGPGQPLVFMFAGNLGVPQNLENDIAGFLRAALPDAELWIVGGGVLHDALVEKYGTPDGAHPIRFWGRQPRVEMPRWFAQADALIISLTDAYRLTLPGKFQSYLKTGKPLLGFISGATRFFIEGEGVPGASLGEGAGRLGWTAAPDNVDAIAAAYRKMADSVRKGEGMLFGDRARKLSSSLFDRAALIGQLRDLAGA
jgi:glycosyltransferase involved in cell wall biosynthesis